MSKQREESHSNQGFVLHLHFNVQNLHVFNFPEPPALSGCKNVSHHEEKGAKRMVSGYFFAQIPDLCCRDGTVLGHGN